MTNLQRRLRKLEASIVDSHGLIPNTPQWLDFWSEKLDRLDAGEDVDLRGITLAVSDAIIEAADLADAANGQQLQRRSSKGGCASLRTGSDPRWRRNTTGG